MYAQVFTRPDIVYIVGMLGKYMSNLGMDHWVVGKWVMCYLKRTKDYLLTNHKLDQLETTIYSDSDYAEC